MPTPTILHLTPTQIGEAINVLAPALVDDPVTCYLFPDPARRMALFETTLKAHLTYGCRYGDVRNLSKGFVQNLLCKF